MKNAVKQFGWSLCGVLLAFVALAPSAFAENDRTHPAESHENLFSVNPFGYVFEWYNVEYEHKLATNSTLGFTSSYWTPDRDRVLAGNAIFRFYPQGIAFKGFYMGGRAGAFQISDSDDDGTFFGAGIELGYTWLMGANQNWYLGLGGGVTRIFGGDLDGSTLIPQIRLINFGYSF